MWNGRNLKVDFHFSFIISPLFPARWPPAARSLDRGNFTRGQSHAGTFSRNRPPVNCLKEQRRDAAATLRSIGTG